MTNWCLDFSAFFHVFGIYCPRRRWINECSVLEACVIVRSWKDPRGGDAGWVAAVCLLCVFIELIAGALQAARLATDGTRAQSGYRRLLIAVKRRCKTLQPWGSVLEHTWPNIRQGWGLKAESALCVGDDCSLTFTWEKGAYVTSLYR